MKRWALRSKRTGHYHSRSELTGALGFAPHPDPEWKPVPMDKTHAHAACRLLTRKFKFQMEVVECPQS